MDRALASTRRLNIHTLIDVLKDVEQAPAEVSRRIVCAHWQSIQWQRWLEEKRKVRNR